MYFCGEFNPFQNNFISRDETYCVVSGHLKFPRRIFSLSDKQPLNSSLESETTFRLRPLHRDAQSESGNSVLLQMHHARNPTSW